MESAHFVTPDQLSIGLYVHLDIGWMNHPFALSSFRIKSEAEIATLRGLGLRRLRYDPAKSTAAPAASAKVIGPVIEAPVVPHEMDPEVAARKKALAEHVTRMRADIQSVERQFKHAADCFKSFTKKVQFNPKEAHREATELVGAMVDNLLVDRDVMLHAMSDQLGEEAYFHSLNVTVLSLILGKALDLPAEQLRELGLGALFHDVGKTDIPRGILLKTDPLTKAEQSLVEQHCQYGLVHARNMELCETARAIVLQHHEHVDGGGYPAQLKADAISPLARLVAITDAYDYLCNPVDVAAAITPAEALARMFALKSKRFDATMLQVFIRCLGVYPAGSVVQLSNDMTGLVISGNAAQSLRPNVLVYDADIPKDQAAIVSLEHEPELKITKNLRPSQLPREVHEYLSPRKRVTYYFDPQQNRKS